MRFLFLLGFISLLYSSPNRYPKPAPNVDTWVPVYMNSESAYKVSFLPPQPVVNSGKIYTIGNYLLQVEKDSGIHVIDYSNRTAPQKIGFIRSVMCSEMSVKGQHLYINNMNDLVVLNIANIQNPSVVSRVPGIFQMSGTEYPTGWGFFECRDASKGTVIGWTIEKRDYPQCYR